MTRRRRQHRRGFSLLEVAAAVGIAAFALLCIAALLPMGAKTNKTSADETRAVFILSALEADLRNTHPTANHGKSRFLGLALPYGVNAAGRVVLNRSLAPNTLSSETTAALGDDEMPRSLSAKPQPRYQVSVVYTRVPEEGSLAPIEARLIVNWPPIQATAPESLVSAALVKGYVETYATFNAP